MRIAYFSPVTPRRSGIADYGEALLLHLAAHVEVELFLEDYEPANEEIRTRFRWRHWREFEAEHRGGRYDLVLYQIGNNPHHAYIYDMAMRIPGVLVLHEFNLHYLMAEVTIVRGDWQGYLRELEYNAGPAALEHGERVRRGETEPEYQRIAMNRRLLENSQAAIAHSQYMVNLIREAGFALPLARIPHGVSIDCAEGSAARRRLGFDQQPVAGAFGFMKPYKRLHSAIHALKRLARPFPNARLLLVGEEHPHYPLRPLIEELGLSDRVHALGFVPLPEFKECIAACDACINLRYPTVGESSGSLLREMAAGKPTLVSNLGSFAELPEDACLKVPPGDKEVEWLAEYLAALWNSPGLRAAIGERARGYAVTECAWERVAEKYAAFLREVAAGQGTVEARPAPAQPGASAGTAAAGEDAGGLVRQIGPPPAGTPLDRAELANYILSWAAMGPEPEDYVRLHLNRLVRTVEITPPAADSSSSLLEMGCYAQITPALRRFLGYEHTRGCYYGKAGITDHKTVYSGTGESFSCFIDLFNAEKDVYPYADESFDTVLCCELVEHLYFDPMYMMSEINRILKPGGHVVLTTPNIIGLRALDALLEGYHPGLFHTYVVPKESGEVDARHNREYAPRDVKCLLESAGFDLKRLETGWLEPDGAARLEPLQRLLEANGMATALRGDIIYAVGQKTAKVRQRYPVELYTSF